MRTAAELDAMHDAIVAKYPGGLTPAQFRQVVLESADEDGKVYPHTIANYFDQMSMLLAMSIKDGLIEHRGGYHAPFNWYITEKGRAALSSTERTEP